MICETKELFSLQSETKIKSDIFCGVVDLYNNFFRNNPARLCDCGRYQGPQCSRSMVTTGL